MIRSTIRLLGNFIWWCTWPILWLLLNNSERTRLVLQDKQGRVLLVRGWLSADSKWGLPGGGLHRREDQLHGVLRETYEEVGIAVDLKSVRKIGVDDIRNRGFRSRIYFFAATVAVTPVLKLRWYEISDAIWIDVATLSSVNAQQDVLRAVQLLVR